LLVLRQFRVRVKNISKSPLKQCGGVERLHPTILEKGWRRGEVRGASRSESPAKWAKAKSARGSGDLRNLDEWEEGRGLNPISGTGHRDALALSWGGKGLDFVKKQDLCLKSGRDQQSESASTYRSR